ncbi:peptide chain release factor N(5)-glutamine methyltransferase [Proteiniborus sp. MB09-C3]|uniref:peptide chain release factor N(5)-glutamine methyltransferase n=1 Tax=Proteiniborus sp. MB09-C3 TaxID=3050072 RepID=UPI002557552A|nr:peptide chain release factor N(5)-glutamine methyltransferase [Proteiniborus sp. MB09-C3]WIV12210.1 peptide chain release factor N(5)-glutamine methyltransferase [Proteiniborus sp. MB09-C3]
MVVAYTIADLIKKGLEALEEGEYNNPLLDSQLLLCNVLNVDKIYTYTHKDQVVDSHFVDKFLNLIDKRKSGYPIQYILKNQEFMGLDFFVKEGVLIPRPDTEVLVEYIIDIVNKGYFNNKDTIKIVDIGTGSGAITLSLAHYLENVHIYSIDVSDIALQVATENSKKLGLESKVTFLNGDLFEPLEKLKLQNSIDIIVSNPPYIPTNDIAGLQKEVAEYEPKLALDGGDDGLDFYRRIVKDSGKYLSDNGVLAMEIGYNQGAAVRKMLEEDKGNVPLSCVEIIKDLAGHDRVVVGFFKAIENGDCKLLP